MVGLPRVPLFVRVSVLAAGISVAEAAKAEPPADTEQPAPRFTKGTVVSVTAEGEGYTVDEATQQAKIAAMTVLLQRFSAEVGGPPDPATAETLLAAAPNWLDLKETWGLTTIKNDKTLVSVRWEIYAHAWDDLVRKHQKKKSFGPITLAESLAGGTRVVATVDTAFAIGDRILAIDDRVVGSLAQVPREKKNIGHRLTVERSGMRFEVGTGGPIPRPSDDLLRRAPTCGACCHGQCDRDPAYPW